VTKETKLKVASPAVTKETKPAAKVSASNNSKAKPKTWSPEVARKSSTVAAVSKKNQVPSRPQWGVGSIKAKPFAVASLTKNFGWICWKIDFETKQQNLQGQSRSQCKRCCSAEDGRNTQKKSRTTSD
jgi:hypothetical protein